MTPNIDELIADAIGHGELYVEQGTRVYRDGHLLVDTYTGLRTIKQCEALAQFIVAAARELSRIRESAKAWEREAEHPDCVGGAYRGGLRKAAADVLGGTSDG